MHSAHTHSNRYSIAIGNGNFTSSFYGKYTSSSTYNVLNLMHTNTANAGAGAVAKAVSVAWRKRFNVL